MPGTLGGGDAGGQGPLDTADANPGDVTRYGLTPPGHDSPWADTQPPEHCPAPSPRGCRSTRVPSRARGHRRRPAHRASPRDTAGAQASGSAHHYWSPAPGTPLSTADAESPGAPLSTAGPRPAARRTWRPETAAPPATTGPRTRDTTQPVRRRQPAAPLGAAGPHSSRRELRPPCHHPVAPRGSASSGPGEAGARERHPPSVWLPSVAGLGGVTARPVPSRRTARREPPSPGPSSGRRRTSATTRSGS